MSVLIAIAVLLGAIALGLVLSKSYRTFSIPLLLLAGVLVGPHGLALLGKGPLLDSAGDLGLLLLLFFTALTARPDAVKQGGRVALPLAAYDLVLNFAAAWWIGSLFGLDTATRLLLAGVVATSSTGAVLKMLGDQGLLQNREGNILITLMWVEDLAFIGYYVFLTGRHTFFSHSSPLAFVVAIGGFLSFLVAVRMMRKRIWRIRSTEVLVPVVTGIGLLGGALGEAAGLPMAGAGFTTGLLLSGGRGQIFADKEAPYVREAAAALFFVSFGAILDPTVTRSILPLAGAAFATIIATELVFIPQVARLLGLHAREGFLLGSSMIARGGKSASVAKLGAETTPSAGATQVQNVAGFLTLILTPLAPFLVRLVMALARPVQKGGRGTSHHETASRVGRRVLLPSPFGARPTSRPAGRIEVIGWYVLAFSLGIFASLIPYPFRPLPVGVGLACLILGYRTTRIYLGAMPRSGLVAGPRSGIAHRPETTHFAAVVYAPAYLVLVLPLITPFMAVAFPVLMGSLLVYLLLVPFLVPAAPTISGTRAARRRGHWWRRKRRMPQPTVASNRSLRAPSWTRPRRNGSLARVAARARATERPWRSRAEDAPAPLKEPTERPILARVR